MSTPITLTPAGMTLSGSYLFTYPKDIPNREVEARLVHFFPQPCWDWTKNDGEANVFLHKTRLASWEEDVHRKDDLTRQRLAWECQMLPLTPEAVRLVLDPPPKPKPVVDFKSKSISISVEVTKTLSQDFGYDDFVALLAMEFDESEETEEEFDAKVLPLWQAFLKKHKKGIVLDDIDEGEQEDGDDFLNDWSSAEDEMRALVNA